MDKENWLLPNGYRYAGVHCGLRPDPNRRDLALVVSDKPATAAGVFTQNRVAAAPVQVCRERLPSPDARGVVICSGNANACTGQQGLEDARRMAALSAKFIGCRPEQMLVASTGVIGHHLPMAKIEAGIRRAAEELRGGAEAFDHVAHAILTTDTRIKMSSRAVRTAGGSYAMAGFAKGAAMIGPNMATMLAFVLTDAPIGMEHLQSLACRAAAETFNCVSVEGHTSTNDTLLFLANGADSPLRGEDAASFDRAAVGVCGDLARAIAADAEGATHFVTIEVDGLRNHEEAHRIAKAVAESALVKTALFGGDPNWGRIVSAAGYAGVPFDEEDLSLWLGELLLYKAGVPQPFDEGAASAYLKTNRAIHLGLSFSLGSGRCTFWTCDLTYDYVRLNADYTT
jgi:glutamate N-acetyltransferase/amino-acid N-acetyltransferase